MPINKEGKESFPLEGILTLKGKDIEITDKDANVETFKANLLSLYNLCKSPEPCMAETFMTKLSAHVGTLRFS